MIFIITLYKGFKYDNRYDYIKTFTTKSEQDTYFLNHDKINLTDYDYIREQTSFNVELSHDYLVTNGVNYLKFNNGYKDMYAFIIAKNYINDEVTELVFEIDVLQTFMFDFNLNKSFIERKVCSINEITDFDEGLEIGEHLIESEEIALEKDSVYFAMFNGIKEQQIIFDEKGKVSNIIQVPYPTAKPLTIVDNIAYPLYFMPLLEQSDYASPSSQPITPPTNSNQSSVITSAIKMIGLPYVWGGNYPPIGTDNGTDCSGLCQWSYQDANVYVNLGGRWTTFTMYPHSQPLEINNVSSGDVMFCSWNTDSMMDIVDWTNDLPSHVALVESVNREDGDTWRINTIEALSERYPIGRRSYIYNPNKMNFGRMAY